MTRILIVGSSGFVGKNLFKGFSSTHETYGLSTHGSQTTTNVGDISSRDETEKILTQTNPDIIIHAAKIRGSIDFYEAHEQETKEVEIGGAKNLANWAKNNARKLVVISTDYVYDGKTNDYNEDSETRPLNKYGGIKLEVEQIAREVPNHLILRSTVIFGFEPNDMNFLMQVLGTQKKRKIPFDQVSNPTDIGVLVDYVRGMIDRDASGTFVATGPESLSRLAFTYLISDVFGLDRNLFEGVATSNLEQIAQRPLNNGTDSSRIRNYLNYDCPTLSQSLERIRRSMR